MSCQRGLSRPPCRIVFSCISQKRHRVFKGSNLDPQAGMVGALPLHQAGPTRLSRCQSPRAEVDFRLKKKK